MKKILFLLLFLSFSMACSMPTKPIIAAEKTETLTLKGTFKSTKGVMTALSCYCFNGGYLTDNNGQEVALCFEDDKNIPCNRIAVTGYYTTQTNTPEPTSPCPKGEARYFKVISLDCFN